MKKSNEFEIGDAIQYFLENNGIKDKAGLKKIMQDWERLMGKPVSDNTEKTWFNEKTQVFYIQMRTPAWKNELNMARSKVKDIINREMNSEVVKEVKIV